MKRFLIALLVGGAIFAVVFGAAAALGPITPNNIQAGSSVISTCDTGGVSVAWKTFTTGWDDDGHPAGGFKVAGVQINDLDAACIGQKVLVALMSAPGSQVGFARGEVVASDGAAVAYCNEFYCSGWEDGIGGCGPWADEVNYVHILIKSSYVSYDAP